MYISKNDFETLKKLEHVIKAWTVMNDVKWGEHWQGELQAILVRLELNRRRSNERAWEAIRERRKTDPNYGRPEREWTRAHRAEAR